MNKEIEISEGYEARIEDNKVIFKLKESEDERIRKALINTLQEKIGLGVISNGYSREDYIVWLEKQGEQKHEEIKDPCVRKYMELDKFALANMLVERDKVNKEVISAFDNLEKQKSSVEEVLIKAGLHSYKDGNQWCILIGNNIQEGICGFGDTIDDALYHLLREAIAYQKEQQPAEWSTEDEEMFDAMIDIVSNSLYEPLCPREGMLAWLKDLPNRLCHLTGGREKLQAKNNESSLVGNKSKQFPIVNVDTSYMDCDQCDF